MAGIKNTNTKSSEILGLLPMLFCAVSMQLQLVYGRMPVMMVILLVVEVSSRD